MNVVKGIFTVSVSFIHTGFIKILHMKRFKAKLIQDISPFTKIIIWRNGSISIGRGLHTRRNVVIEAMDGGKISIGDHTGFNYGCGITSKESISIGSRCSFGPNVFIYDHDHNYRDSNGLKGCTYITDPVVIGNNVWIGANVVILKGTILEDNCVVAAGSVIQGHFAKNSVVVQKRETTVKVYQIGE